MADGPARPPGGPDPIRIELAVAFPEHQFLIPLELPAGATIADAIEKAGIRELFPDLEIAPGRVGVFGAIRPLDHRLAHGERVEVYRPLKADPREVRRELARLNKPRS